MEAADFILYNGSAVLRDLSDVTGAMIDVSGDRDTPKRLSDRIVTISGQVEQKEGACRGIVQKLRKLQDLQDDKDIGFFVIIVPASSVPVVVGAQGANIKEVLASAEGVELSIGKENIMGMPDTPIGLEGTAGQVTTAVAAIHKVVQEMADRGRLMPADFKYRPDKAAAALASGAGQGLPEVALPPTGHDPFGGLDPTQNFRTKAKLVIDTASAGWLIGKGGRTIREMQENSGAFLHILREEDSPPVLRPGDRLLEICGRYERKLEGLQIVMRTADNMPGNQAPKETIIMVPSPLALPEVLEEVSTKFGVGLSAQDFPGHEESLVTITGTASTRIQVAQNFLTRTDKAHMDGTVVARSVDGEVVGKDGRMRKELREPGAYPEPPPRGATSADMIVGMVQEPVSRSLQKPSEQQHVMQPRAPLPQAVRVPTQERVVEQLQANHLREQPNEHPQWGAPQRTRGPSTEQVAWPWPAQQYEGIPDRSSQLERKPAVVEPMPRSSPPTATLAQEPSSCGSNAQRSGTPSVEPAVEPPRQDWARESKFESTAPSIFDVREHEGSSEKLSARFSSEKVSEHARQSNECCSTAVNIPASICSEDGSTCGAMAQYGARSLGHHSVPGPPNIGLADPAALFAAGPKVEALLASNTRCPQATTQMFLLLPDALIHEKLVPSGHIQHIAQRCQVQIDLGETLQSSRQVKLTGSLLGTAAAAYWIQVGMSHYA